MASGDFTTFNIDDYITGGARLPELIDELTRVDTLLNKLIEHHTANAKQYADNLSEIEQAAARLDDTMGKLNVTNKKDQDTMSKGAAEMEDLTQSSDDYNAAALKTQKQIEELIAAQKSLQESTAKVKEQNTAAAGSLEDLRKQLKAAELEYTKMGDAERQISGKDTLTRITTLSKQIKEQDTALKNAKRGVDLAKGSYYELTAQVNKAKQELKAMEGGIGSESEEFKKLQKVVKDGTDELKKLDEAMGDNQRDVGNYELAIDALDKRFGGLITTAKDAYAQFAALAKNPFFLLIGALIGSVVGAYKLLRDAVNTYYEETADGEDILEERLSAQAAFQDLLKQKWAEYGKQASTSLDSINDRGANQLTWLQKAKLAWLSLLDAARGTKLADELIVAADAGKELADKLDALDDDITRNVVESAKSQRKANEEILKSKNQLLYSDEQRLDFLRSAVATQEGQEKKDLEISKRQLASLEEQIALGKAISVQALRNADDQEIFTLIQADEAKQIFEARARIIQQEADFFQSQKRNALGIQALVLEIEKRKRDAYQRTVDTRREIDKAILAEEIKTQKTILDAEESTLDQRVQALLETNKLQLDQLEADKTAELDIIQRAAEERIRAEGKNVTEELLGQDQALLNQREMIQNKYEALVLDTNERLKTGVKDNFWKVLQRDATIATAEAKTALDLQLTALNENLNDGTITIKQYEDERKRLQVETQRELLLNQLAFLKKQVSQLKEGTAQKQAILEKIAETEMQLSQITTDAVIEDIHKKEAAEKTIAALVQQIKQAAFDLATSLVDAEAQRTIDALNRQGQAAQEQYDKDVAAAGDNIEAKKLLEQDFQDTMKGISAQVREAQRKAAQYNKILSAAQIVIDTASAIMKTLGQGGLYAIPIAAAIGAIGAINLAKVLSTPIPSFYTGTESAPGGFALVADRFGPELTVEPGGAMKYYSKPNTVTYLERGTRVFNAADTSKIMEILEAGNLSRSFVDAGGNLVMDRDIVVNTDNSDVVDAIRESRGPDYIRVWDDMHIVKNAQAKRDESVHKSYFGY